MGASALQGVVAAEGSAGKLQDWLRESGGSWQGASVAALEGQVVEEFSVVSSASGESRDPARAESRNPWDPETPVWLW